MKFALSQETINLIQQSSSLDYKHQRSTSICDVRTKIHQNSDYIVKEPRDVAPRGSIYLQMGRIMSLRKIKSYLKGI